MPADPGYDIFLKSMHPTPQHIAFLEKRKTLVRSWKYLGPLLLVFILGLAAYVYLTAPMLINPYEVMEALRSGAIEQSTIEIMAVLLPITFLMVCFLLIVLVLVMYMAFANERKYLEILEKTDPAE